MTDYTELQKAAEYAAQDTIKFADEDEEMRALQQFHEEVDPETVIALIAENERLFKLLERTVEQYVPLTELEGVPGWSRVVELVEVVAQRDQLRAEVAGLRTGYEAYERVNAELKAEKEALRKDVERYQWLRLADWWRSPICAIRHPKEQAKLGSDCPTGERLDSAIDAAMGQGEQS